MSYGMCLVLLFFYIFCEYLKIMNDRKFLCRGDNF